LPDNNRDKKGNIDIKPHSLLDFTTWIINSVMAMDSGVVNYLICHKSSSRYWGSCSCYFILVVNWVMKFFIPFLFSFSHPCLLPCAFRVLPSRMGGLLSFTLEFGHSIWLGQWKVNGKGMCASSRSSPKKYQMFICVFLPQAMRRTCPWLLLD
jgi:hypothetical protein